MPEKVRIALDAMGGDHGASVVVPGAEIALKRHPDTEFIFYGDRAVVAPLLAKYPAVKAASRLVHTDVVVKMEDKPSQALRAGRWKSSMWLAIDAIKKGEADAVVSSGNTGALMAMARFNLRTMATIERPAIAALWPTLKGESVVLDVGATIGAHSQHIVDMAVMGSAMARIVLHLDRPKVGLLNIGVEEVKGLEEVREAGRILRETPLPGLEYVGFIEGNDIGTGVVDVVVTEGFAGNIALKTAEGTARQLAQTLREAMTRNWRAKLGYLLAHEAFNTLRDKMDPRKVNGGVFLGLNGIVIKSHGGTDAEGFASAVNLGYDMVRDELLAKISQTLDHYAGGATASTSPVAGGAAS
jgi:glycerol-3-phosphate acyltransferase PlsX